MEGSLHKNVGGLNFGGAHTRRGLFSKFYGIAEELSSNPPRAANEPATPGCTSSALSSES